VRSYDFFANVPRFSANSFTIFRQSRIPKTPPVCYICAARPLYMHRPSVVYVSPVRYICIARPLYMCHPCTRRPPPACSPSIAFRNVRRRFRVRYPMVSRWLSNGFRQL